MGADDSLALQAEIAHPCSRSSTVAGRQRHFARDGSTPMRSIDRLKKEMSEGVVRAILEHSGYVVTDSGIEDLIPAYSRRCHDTPHRRRFPAAMRKLPDFVVNADDGTEELVEVKYRSEWSCDLFAELDEQVSLLGELTLISINATADDPKSLGMSLSRYVRCCRLRFANGAVEAELAPDDYKASRTFEWSRIDDLSNNAGLWWRMARLTERFPAVRMPANVGILSEAVAAISGILKPAGPQPAYRGIKK